MFIDLFQRFVLCQTFIFTQIRIRYVNTVKTPALAAASGPGCYRVLVLTDREQETMLINVKLIISSSPTS